ncbi:MAG: MBL fold metallo-hydrolase [Bacteroidales bacterium]|nr:MBL fold metallo-hydrolase [Bacteroidales bacterium]MBN2748160.1 MBL fold metallo-hydrolase [Bacteroidales bacterium]
MTVKISVLVDNIAGRSFKAEHGLSYFISADKDVLLDTGSSNLFLQNAAKLGIDVAKSDYVVLSHGHWDHGNGLVHLPSGLLLVAHPDIFASRISKRSGNPVGIPITRSEAAQKFNMRLSVEPVWLSEQMVFLGEIPRLNNFESQTTDFAYTDMSPDFIPDDTAIAIKTPKGLVVVTGCSHAGICNIVDYAIRVTGQRSVRAVVGGLHLDKVDEQYYKTIEHMEELGVQEVVPSHCTSFEVSAQFFAKYGKQPLKSGFVLCY